MEEMVFLDPPHMKETPFTTSEVVARFAGVQHHAVQQIAHRIGIALFKSHQGIAATEINGVRRHGNHVVQIAVFERDDAGKDLCGAGREDRLVRVFFNALVGNRRILRIDKNIVRFID